MTKDLLLHTAHNAFSCMIQKAKQHIKCIECGDEDWKTKREMIKFWESEINDAREAYYKIKEFVELHKWD